MLPHHAFFFHQIIKRASQNREYKCSTYSVSSLESSSKRPGDRLLNLFPPKSLLFPITQVADKKKKKKKKTFFPSCHKREGKTKAESRLSRYIYSSLFLSCFLSPPSQTDSKKIYTHRSLNSVRASNMLPGKFVRSLSPKYLLSKTTNSLAHSLFSSTAAVKHHSLYIQFRQPA